MKDDRKEIGSIGERIALQRLQDAGYAIVETNWRCKHGEIDIIALTGQVIVIVEVRTRRQSNTFGSAQESVNGAKQRKLQWLAQYYMTTHNMTHRNVRFDVIAILINHHHQIQRYDHIEAAF